MFRHKWIIIGLTLVAVLAVSTMLAAPALAGKNGNGGGGYGKAEFLLIDLDSIDNGIASIGAISFNDPFCGKVLGSDPPTGDPAACVNDDIAVDAGSGLTTPLFTRAKDGAPGSWDITPYSGLVLPTGQVGNEGLFSVGLSYADLEAFIEDTLPNADLASIPGSPLTEAEIYYLLGKVVCAKVKDSDVSDLGGGLLNAQGAYYGLTAFEVTEVNPNPADGSYLPLITVDLLASRDVQKMCESSASGSGGKGGGGNGGAEKGGGNGNGKDKPPE